MKNQENLYNSQDSVNVNSQDEYAPQKRNTLRVGILIACLILSFAFWCFAHYQNDPMIQKDIVVNFILVNGESNEAITPQFHYFTFYGPQSILADKSVVNIEVDRKMFDEYNVYTTIPISYNSEFHSHTNEVELRLIKTNILQDDSNTDK